MMSMRMAVKAARRGGDEAVDGLLTILGGGDERAALFEHIGRDLAVEGIVFGHEDTDAVETRARFRLWRGRPVRCVDRQRKCDGEGRALALAADERDIAAEQFDGLLRDSEAEAAAGTGEDEGRRAVFTRGLAAGDAHRTAGTVIFDSVAHDVLQYTLNIQRTAAQAPVCPLGRVGCKSDAAVRHLCGNDRSRALQHIAQVERLMLGLGLACFELAHVEQVVRSREDIGKAVLHTRGIGDIFFGNLRHAADTVDGRADIVAMRRRKSVLVVLASEACSAVSLRRC